MFSGISQQKFNQYFQCEDDCKHYLFELKWKEGYKCRRCAHDKYWKGKTAFHVRCTRCDYDESVTSNTIFHKLKFPLLKAFGIAFQVLVIKKGRSSVDLAKEYDIGIKSAWAFRRKIQKAMGEPHVQGRNEPLPKEFALDSITINHRAKSINGFQRINLSISCSAAQNGQKGYKYNCRASVPFSDKVSLSHLVGGKFMGAKKSLLVYNLKVWLTGVHHHCSVKYLQGYLDEFFFKYNFRNRTGELWHLLMERITEDKSIKLIANGT